MKLSTIIRLILSVVIIYFIYKETGTATTIFCVTVCIYIEINGLRNKLIYKSIKDLTEPKTILSKEPKKKSKWQQRLDEIKNLK